MKKLLFFISLLLLAACSSYTVLDSKVYNQAVLSQYKTFAIAAPESNAMPPGMTMRDYDALATAVRDQLIRRGYEEASNPDLVVYIGISVNDKIETKDAIPPTAPYYFGRRGAWMRNYYSDTKVITGVSKEGIVSVDIVDEKEQKVVYAGSVSSLVDRQQHIRDLDELNKAMTDLFKKFPVQPLY